MCPQVELYVPANPPRCARKPTPVCPQPQPGMPTIQARCVHEPTSVCPQPQPGVPAYPSRIYQIRPRCAHEPTPDLPNPPPVCPQTHPGFAKSDPGFPKSELGFGKSELEVTCLTGVNTPIAEVNVLNFVCAISDESVAFWKDGRSFNTPSVFASFSRSLRGAAVGGIERFRRFRWLHHRLFSFEPPARDSWRETSAFQLG